MGALTRAIHPAHLLVDGLREYFRHCVTADPVSMKSDTAGLGIAAVATGIFPCKNHMDKKCMSSAISGILLA